MIHPTSPRLLSFDSWCNLEQPLGGAGLCWDGGLERPRDSCLALNYTSVPPEPVISWNYTACPPEDECANGHHTCDPLSETCADTEDGFTCQCSDGYRLDGYGYRVLTGFVRREAGPQECGGYVTRRGCKVWIGRGTRT